MRILLINPNTSPDITALAARAARGFAAPGSEIVPVTGRFGGRYIATRATYAIAAHAALDAFCAHGEGVDAVALACFGDPGLAALKEIARVPVVGMAEAACRAADASGRRYAIVTGGALWAPMLSEFVVQIGAERHFAGVATVAPSGADIARDPDGSLALLAAACEDCAARLGAETVILGGAGLAGLAERIAPRVGVPLIDGFAALMSAVEAAVGHAVASPPAGSVPAIATVGLDPKLARALLG